MNKFEIFREGRRTMTMKKTIFLLAVILLPGIFTQANATNFYRPPSQETQSRQLELTSQQPDSAQTAAAQDSTQLAGQSKITTFWELYQHGGNISYIIMGVLVVGIFILVAKAVELLIDWRNAKHLVKLPFRDLDRIKEALAKSKPSYLKDMLQHLINFFDAGYSAANAQFELNVFKHVKYEKFESYQGWLHFLSDTAGALGLMGTVWGIFQTFFGGNLDNEKILNGMGMALITTLFGLIVSLIINFGNTKIFSSFNKRMELIAGKGDKLRLFLMDWEAMKRPVRYRLPATAAPAENTSSSNGGPKIEQLIENIGVSISRSIEKSLSPAPTALPATVQNGMDEGVAMLLVESPPREIATGETINKALCVGVVDENRMPMPKTKVIFQTSGELYLDRNQRKVEKYTDRNGQITISLRGGDHVGTAELNYWLEKDSSVMSNVDIEVVAGKAERIAIQKGNHQSARVGQRLADMLQVSIQDQFGNPVSGVDVLYKLLEGEGVFNGGHPNYVTQTDSDGFAEAEYSLGQAPGVQRVQAVIKGSRSKPVEFVLFSTTEE